MKKILTLGPNTFLWVNERKGLIYNSKNYKSLEFNLTPGISKLCNILLEYNHLYSVQYDECADSSIKGFIEGIVSIDAGYVHEVSKSVLSLPPLLKIQHDMNFLKKRGNEFQDFALRYLSKLIVFVGGSCEENIYCKQTIYPVNSLDTLSGHEIICFLKSIVSPYLSEIVIIFSDIQKYNDLMMLANYLGTLKSNITICISNEEENVPIKEILKCSDNIKIKYVYKPGRFDKLHIHSEDANVVHTFLISSEDNYVEFEKIYNKHTTDNLEVIPVFNGRNFEFIKHNVFLSKNEILSSELTKRDIFIHQVLNNNFFGTLYVMPDGKIYSDLSSPALGDINDCIYDIILKEISLNYSWRQVRDSGKCQLCLYRELCPSPSVYEKLMSVECICVDK